MNPIHQVAYLKEEELTVEALNRMISDINRALLYLQQQGKKP